MNRFVVAFPFAALLLSFAPLASAQNGDNGKEKQPEVWKKFDVPPAPVVSPQDSLSHLLIAPGFRVELVASEPLVEDPVAIAFDPAGRLWVVELRGYMPDVDGKGEGAPVGQVVVLDDDDHDGRMDRSTVFLDKLVNPRAIAIVKDGVFIAEPKNLWLCRDTDGDSRCDEKTSVIQYGSDHPNHLEHTENGLLWGLDNWIYNAKSKRRMRWSGGRMVEANTQFRGQWGIAQDNYGRLYYNGNSSWLFGDAVPAEYVLRNPHCGKSVGQLHPIGQRIVRDESVHTIRVNTGINRGYQKHMLRADGRLARTTSVSGLTIYRGDQFPPHYVGDAFVPEPAGNVLAHFRLTHEGIKTHADHQLFEDETWGKREFMASTDERFRPVDCTVGPDGALYVVDMYRGILQHRMYVTTFLRKQILERGLDKPIGLGRIYRVVWEGRPIDRRVNVGAESGARVVALSHRNGWVRDTAQRLLVETADPKSVPTLRALATNSPGVLPRLHAMWALHGMGAVDGAHALDLATTRANLNHPDPTVQVHAMRTGEQWIGHKQHEGSFLLAMMERAEEPLDPAVRVQMMFTLGSFPLSSSDANDLKLELLAAGIDDRLLRTAALSGWRGRALGALGQLADDEEWTEASSGRTAMFRELAHAALRHRPGDLAALLARVSSDQTWRDRAILAGAVSYLDQSKRKVQLSPRPAILTKTVADPDMAKQLSRIATSVTEGPAVKPLTAAEQTLFAEGAVVYEACAVCHGQFGEGVPGLAPQLADSPWVTGRDDHLVRILVHGLQGPLVVAGQRWNDTMPPPEDQVSDDRSVAAVLTYIRRSWGHAGDAVSMETVKRVRALHAERSDPWTVDELKEIPQ